MTEVILYSEGSNSLLGFQTVIQQQEGIIGPLVAIKRVGAKNAITFRDGNAPSNRSILEKYSTPNPSTKSGYSHVCHGVCLVRGAETKVVAYRKQ